MAKTFSFVKKIFCHMKEPILHMKKRSGDMEKSVFHVPD